MLLNKVSWEKYGTIPWAGHSLIDPFQNTTGSEVFKYR